MNTTCPLCVTSSDKQILWENNLLRVIQVNTPFFPGFCRVIWNEHVSEMSDLCAAKQRYLMEIVFATERVLRALLHPDKINLASLGNQVPHLHWHIIPRFIWDSHFPDPIWAKQKRDANHSKIALLNARLPTLPMVLSSTLASTALTPH